MTVGFVPRTFNASFREDAFWNFDFTDLTEVDSTGTGLPGPGLQFGPLDSVVHLTRGRVLRDHRRNVPPLHFAERRVAGDL